MKVLISAYACNPYGGSESGVGWTAVCRIALKHDVFVITDIHNRAGWDEAAANGIIPANVAVRFLRDKSACSENRMIAHLQSWLNYASFNRQILAEAGSWHQQEHFSLCHQVTIAGWRMPSPLWQLPIPFIWGPIGGTGHIPVPFRSMLSMSSRLFEWARDMNTLVIRRTKAFRKCITKASIVFAANEETEEFLRPYRSGLPLVRLPIASLPAEKVTLFRRQDSETIGDQPLRLFAGGNIEGRKGVSLALKALALVSQRQVKFHYTIAGGGPEVESLKNLASRLGIRESVDFNLGYSGSDYVQALHRTDVYFLPSFRESTPVTLLESYLAGCYPVVVNTSAQGEIVRLAGGIAVEPLDPESVVSALADAIIWCSQNRKTLRDFPSVSIPKLTQYFSATRYDETLDRAYADALK
jgi:glycosyltransferase involved in cell wall biosynthesis